MAALQTRRRELESKATKLADAIAEVGHSPALLATLSRVEHEISGIDDVMRSRRGSDLSPGLKQIEDFVTRNLVGLSNLVRDDPSRAKAAFKQHLDQLVLTPHRAAEGPVFEVSGAISLSKGKDVMLVVARDGVEPPTPAFSGPLADRSEAFETRHKTLIYNNLRKLFLAA